MQPRQGFLFYLCRMKETQKAHLALLATTLVFGFAYNIVKGLMPAILLPMQLIFIRMLGGDDHLLVISATFRT